MNVLYIERYPTYKARHTSSNVMNEAGIQEDDLTKLMSWIERKWGFETIEVGERDGDVVVMIKNKLGIVRREFIIATCDDGHHKQMKALLEGTLLAK